MTKLKRIYDINYKSCRKQHELDISIISSSRPECLDKMYKSFKKYVFTNSELRFIIHEDNCNNDKSNKVLQIISKWKENIKICGSTNHSNAKAMDYVKSIWRTNYVFHIQDDWEFERPIELDRILWTMDNNPFIGCIFFNKQSNDTILDFEPLEVEKDGLKLCTSYFWPFLPGIWRAKSFREHWQFRERNPEGFFNQQFGNVDILKKRAAGDTLGFYMYGEKNTPRYVRHTGENLSTLPWKPDKQKKKPIRDYSVSDLRCRAPWLPFPKELPK